MKIHDCEQNTTAWLDLRAGIPTASQFHRIITPKRLQPSESATEYMHELLAERLLGRPLVGYVSSDMERGKDLEPDAVGFYEFTQGVDTVAVGFVTNDEGTIGASPDRLVGDTGLLETKVPKESTHIAHLLGRGVDEKYRIQLMGQLWVAEREWVHILSYNPSLPPALVRVERDEAVIKAVAGAVTSFSMDLESRWQKLKAEYVKDEEPDRKDVDAIEWNKSLFLQREDAYVMDSDIWDGDPEVPAVQPDSGEDAE